MGTIEDNFVKPEQVVVLCETGFKEPSFMKWKIFYGSSKPCLDNPDGMWQRYKSNGRVKSKIRAPLYQQVFDWFEEKGLYCNISYHSGLNRYSYIVYRNDEDRVEKEFQLMDDQTFYKSKEYARVACLDAIIEKYIKYEKHGKS